MDRSLCLGIGRSKKGARPMSSWRLRNFRNNMWALERTSACYSNSAKPSPCIPSPSSDYNCNSLGQRSSQCWLEFSALKSEALYVAPWAYHVSWLCALQTVEFSGVCWAVPSNSTPAERCQSGFGNGRTANQRSFAAFPAFQAPDRDPLRQNQ